MSRPSPAAAPPDTDIRIARQVLESAHTAALCVRGAANRAHPDTILLVDDGTPSFVTPRGGMLAEAGAEQRAALFEVTAEFDAETTGLTICTRAAFRGTLVTCATQCVLGRLMDVVSLTVDDVRVEHTARTVHDTG